MVSTTLKWTFAFILFVTFSLIVACGSNDNSNEMQVSLDQASADVKNVYQANCMSCHAIDLSGKMGERTNLQTVYERLSYDEIKQTIMKGGETMRPFDERLTEEQIAGLAKWLAKVASDPS